MYAVIYHWRLKPGASEKEFLESWHNGTLDTFKNYGSYGSCLHKMSDGTYVAYARWPDREHWERMMQASREGRKPFSSKPFVEPINEPKCLEVLDDLLTDELF